MFMCVFITAVPITKLFMCVFICYCSLLLQYLWCSNPPRVPVPDCYWFHRITKKSSFRLENGCTYELASSFPGTKFQLGTKSRSTVLFEFFLVLVLQIMKTPFAPQARVSNDCKSYMIIYHHERP